MDGKTSIPTSSGTHHYVLWGLLTLLVVLAGVGLEYPRFEATFTPARVFFVDPDDYTRVYRAQQIAAGRSVLIRDMPEINSPRGVSLHWTAPMDYVVAAAGLVAGLLTDHPDPMGVGAAWTPVGLGILYVSGMILWIRRGFGWGAALLAGLLVILSPAFHRTFALGHPDHHALLALLFVIAVGSWMPRRSGDGGRETPTRCAAAISGLATGAAIWVASLAMLVWGAILCGLIWACLRSKSDNVSPHRVVWRAWSLSTAAVVLVAYLIENGLTIHAMAIDKISMVHVASVLIVLMIPLLWAGHADATSTLATSASPYEGPDTVSPPLSIAGESEKNVTQTLSLLAMLAAYVVWIAFYYDRVFQYVNRPEFIRWSENIAELQPLFIHVESHWSLRQMYDRLGFLPYALPLLLIMFLRARRVPPVLRVALGLLAPLLVVLTLFQRRWLDHYNLAVIPVAVIGLQDGLDHLFTRRRPLKPIIRFALSAVVLGLLTWPACRTILGRRSKDELAARSLLDRTDFVAQIISAYEKGHTSPHPSRRSILCEDGDGPMLLYYTHLPVIAAPYHRAIDGIVEAARFFAERNPTKAREQLDRLGVRFIVMPFRAHEQLMHFEWIVFGRWRSFDPPDQTIDSSGHLVQELHYRPEITKTMIYRMVTQPETQCIPGVELIGRSQEDPGRPGRINGLVYAVRDLATDRRSNTALRPLLP